MNEAQLVCHRHSGPAGGGAAWLQTVCKRHCGSLRAQVQSAYAQTLTQQYPQAQQAFRQAAHSARQASKKLGLLVRRNALDRMNETMAVLPQYANPENQADLAVEAARVLAQIDQLEQCFTGTF